MKTIIKTKEEVKQLAKEKQLTEAETIRILKLCHNLKIIDEKNLSKDRFLEWVNEEINDVEESCKDNWNVLDSHRKQTLNEIKERYNELKGE